MKLKSLFSATAIASAALFSTHVSAACFIAPPQSFSTVTANNNGTYHYSTTAMGGFVSCGGTPTGPDRPGYMSDFYLPYFDDMGIAGLSVAATGGPANSNWLFDIEGSNDLFNFGGGVMHFYNANTPTTLAYNSILINFDAGFGEVKAPFAATVADLNNGNTRNFFGDPGMPGSPKLIDALDGPAQGNVPEPASISLFALGAMALFALRRKSV